LSQGILSIITRSQTAQTRWPNVERPPGLIGVNSPFEGYPYDNHVLHEVRKNKNTKKYKKNTKPKKYQDNSKQCNTVSKVGTENNIKIL